MSMTEQGTQMTQSAMIDLSKTGAKLTVNAVSLTASSMRSLLSFAVTALQNARLNHNNRPGQTTISRLQERTGGDVHAQVIDPSLEKKLRKELNSRGISFAVEHAPDGQTYIHFAGKDLPSLEHAVTQAEARLGISETKQQTAPEPKVQPTQDTPEPQGTKTQAAAEPTTTTLKTPEPTEPTRPDPAAVWSGPEQPRQAAARTAGRQPATISPRGSAKPRPATKTDVVNRIQTRAQQLVKTPAAKSAPIKIRGAR